VISLLLASHTAAPSSGPGPQQLRLDVVGPCLCCQRPMRWGQNVQTSEGIDDAEQHRTCETCLESIDRHILDPHS
jgi:hypothetical protein